MLLPYYHNSLFMNTGNIFPKCTILIKYLSKMLNSKSKHCCQDCFLGFVEHLPIYWEMSIFHILEAFVSFLSIETETEDVFSIFYFDKWMLTQSFGGRVTTQWLSQIGFLSLCFSGGCLSVFKTSFCISKSTCGSAVNITVQETNQGLGIFCD